MHLCSVNDTGKANEAHALLRLLPVIGADELVAKCFQGFLDSATISSGRIEDQRHGHIFHLAAIRHFAVGEPVQRRRRGRLHRCWSALGRRLLRGRGRRLAQINDAAAFRAFEFQGTAGRQLAEGLIDFGLLLCGKAQGRLTVGANGAHRVLELKSNNFNGVMAC